MDIDIVNAILRLCHEQQTCLFEVPTLVDLCLERRLCSNSKYVLASIKNYIEIFRISRDRNRIELFMPFEFCRNNSFDNSCQINGQSCSNLHLCYDYFYTNTCRRSINCPYGHQLIAKHHEYILRTLINLDLDALTKAFRVYCQSKRHLINHNSSNTTSIRGQQSTTSLMNNSNVSTSTNSNNNWRLPIPTQINGDASWKANNRTVLIPRISPTPIKTLHQIIEKGLQICWTPIKDIPNHFVQVAFSNSSKSDGGPIRRYTLYQHLGIAQIFYQNSETVDRVIQHGPVTFQSFTFTPRLLQRTIDTRHLCFANISYDITRIPLYIDTVSMPYKKNHFDYYQNDQQIILVEYQEDIDYSRICSNVRTHPEYSISPVQCIQLYHPETLFIEYDQEYTQLQLEEILQNYKIFHIKIYTLCAFVHFYCHADLIQSIKTLFEHSIKATPIYINVYSSRHLEKYLQQHENDIENKFSSTNDVIENNEIISENNLNISTQLESPIGEKIELEILSEPESNLSTKEIDSCIESQNISNIIDDQIETEVSILNDDFIEKDENEFQNSDDDLQDLISEFDNEDLLLGEFTDNNGDTEFLRSAAENLLSSLTEMNAASANMDTMNAPHSLLYGDDYIVTIKDRRFALGFLNYTQLRVEKQRNPDKFRLLAALKKNSNINMKKKRIDHRGRDETPSPPTIQSEFLSIIETKSNKKKRNRRTKKNKIRNQDKIEPTFESINDEDQRRDENEEQQQQQEEVENDNDNTIHVLNDQEFPSNNYTDQRLPHVYLNNDFKPYIVVPGEEHSEENEHDNGDHEDWHNIVAGGKQVPIIKKSKKKKQQQQTSSSSSSQKDEKTKIESIEQVISSPVNKSIIPQASQMEPNAIIIPFDCRGFVHHPKQYETFRLRLRRSFPSINIRFQLNTYMMIIDGNIKLNVQQCLIYLNSLAKFKHTFLISYENFPSTTITNIIRMQQSTAQIKLDPNANYNRIFRSTYRLIDYQLKQQYHQQQCIYCRRSHRQFRITHLIFPLDKKLLDEFIEQIRQRVMQLLTTRFTYIAMSLSADLIQTKRWKNFYQNLINHKELNRTILIRKLNTIIQVYGVHANVQQIQTLITKFVDTNRYETDVIESEQANGIFSLLKNDFQLMEKDEIFVDAELRFIYRHHRRLLVVQCFQEKLQLVKTRIDKLRSQLSTILHSVRSSILIRYYSTSNQIENIALTSNCIITIEQHLDSNRINDEQIIDLKIFGRSPDKALKLIKEFEEENYSTRKIHYQNIHLFVDDDIKQLENQCTTLNVFHTIDQTNNLIELEGLTRNFDQIENFIQDLCSIVARRTLNDRQNLFQWIYYDQLKNKYLPFDESIKQQLEIYYLAKKKGLFQIKDSLEQIHTFDLENMIEIQYETNGNNSPIKIKIERKDTRNPQLVQLPTHWTSMNKPSDRIFLGRRENLAEWKANPEIQRLLKLPHMLPDSWIVEIHRIQNPRMFQQYMAYRENIPGRPQDIERTLYRLVLQSNLLDDICAQGFDRSHRDAAFSAYGHGCHFYCKAIDIDRTVTLLAQNHQSTPIMLQQQTTSKAPVRFLFVCKVLVGRYTRGDASMQTCPLGYDSLVNDIDSPEIFVTYQDAQVLPEYLITYQSAIF